MPSKLPRKRSRRFSLAAVSDSHFLHDLEELLQLLEKNGLKVPKYVWEAEELSRFAVTTRYPGMADPVTRRQYRRAVRIAAAVVRCSGRQVERTQEWASCTNHETLEKK